MDIIAEGVIAPEPSEQPRKKAPSAARRKPSNPPRSLPEEKLFALLEKDRELSGLFRMNELLPIAFGRSKRMEADFACESHRIIVEVDGFYHFQSPDHYRRDRQKDALLQKAGWLVLRFLAEDVMDKPQSVLGSIRQAVREQGRVRNPG